MHFLKEITQKCFGGFFNPFYSILFIAVLSAYYFGITGSAWAVTGEFTRWGGEILGLFGIDTSSWEYFQIIGLKGSIFTRKDGIMIIGMFLGALIATLLSARFKLRIPSFKIILQALIGGIIAGFGARLGMGCNLASFFTGIPQFSLHAWIFTLLSIVGVYFGILVIQRQNLGIDMKKGSFSPPKKHNLKPISYALGILVLIFSVILSIYLMQSDSLIAPKSLLGIALFFGLVFGFVISRAQICFTSAFRDLFLTGRSITARAIVIGMMISTIGVFGFILLGVEPKIVWAGPNVAIGGLLFGFGIVIAGGCECGWMYRAMEGQIQYIIVGIGNIIGSVILALSWDSFSQPLAKAWPKINLLESFGAYGGLFINLGLLALFLGLIAWLEIRAKKKILLDIKK